MPNTHRQNRETFVRLFQGFVNEYGEAAGKKIVKHLVDNAGGLRINIPSNDIQVNQYLVIHGDPLCTQSACFRGLWRSTCREFGQASGRAIMKKIITELGDRRVYFPDYQDFYKWERNKKMKNQYTGNNIDEIAARWNLSPQRALQIVTGEEERERLADPFHRVERLVGRLAERRKTMWEQIETYFLHHEEKEIFAVILEGETGCHWAWYVIDDENGVLLGLGSDDELQAAKINAEKAMGIC